MSVLISVTALSPMSGLILYHSVGSSADGSVCSDPIILQHCGYSIILPLQTEHTVGRKVCCGIHGGFRNYIVQCICLTSWLNLHKTSKHFLGATQLSFFCSMEPIQQTQDVANAETGWWCSWGLLLTLCLTRLKLQHILLVKWFHF